ncbi:MAG TPA: hypothetical protein DDZ89_09860 [Clostridiales bacterium]|nr:hypothetical protein [Clostridiales bacterium]
MKKGWIALVVVLFMIMIAGGIYIYNLSKELAGDVAVPYDPGDVFVTNLSDGKSLVKVDLMLEVRNKKAVAGLKKINYKLRDSIISVLRGKTKEDLIQSDQWKNEISERIMEDLGIQDIVGVYFQEIIVQ